MSSENHTTTGCPSNISVEELMVNEFRAYVSPTLAIVGIPANTLTMIIFSILQHQSSCRFNLYAIWLAFSYNIQLVTNCLLDDFFGRGLRWATGCRFWIQVDTISSFTCKLLTYLSESSALIKACLLMYFSADRVFSVYFPDRFPANDGLWYARGGIIGSFVICLILNIPQLIYVNLVKESKDSYSCSYVNPVDPGVQFVLYLYIIGATLLPAILIFITNLLILYKMWSMMKSKSTKGKLDSESSNELCKIVAHLAIGIFFQLLSFPSVVAIILRQEVYLLHYDKTRPVYAKRVIMLTKLFSSLDCINYAFEFFIYLAFMPSFREALRCLFTGSIKRKQSDSTEWNKTVSSTGRILHKDDNVPTLHSTRKILKSNLSSSTNSLSLSQNKKQLPSVIITRL